MTLNDAQRKLVEDNINLVFAALRKYISNWNPEDEDTVSIGYIGLCKAAATFDPMRSVAFSTYAVRCILNEIYREFRHQDRKCRGSGETPVSLNLKHILEDGWSVEYIDMLDDPLQDTERIALEPMFIDSISKLAPTIVEMVRCELSPKEMASKHFITRQGIHNRINKERARLYRSGALAL